MTPLRDCSPQELRQAWGEMIGRCNRGIRGSAEYKANIHWLDAVKRELRRRDKRIDPLTAYVMGGQI